MADIRLNIQRRLSARDKNKMNVTRAWKYIAKVKDIKNFNEKFPNDVEPRITNRKSINVFDNLPSSMDNPAFAHVDVELRRSKVDDKSIPFNEKYLDNKRRLLLRSDSFRSSTASIPEVIEECSSDDEANDKQSVDYMNCINCALTKSTTSIDSTTSDPFIRLGMNSCYRCRHLNAFSKDKLSIPHLMVNNRLNRPLSWSAGDWMTESSQKLRKSGLSVSSELPSISESNDESEEGSDETNESEKFRDSNSSMRRRTIGNENELKNLRKAKKFKFVRKNCDFVKI